MMTGHILARVRSVRGKHERKIDSTGLPRDSQFIGVKLWRRRRRRSTIYWHPTLLDTMTDTELFIIASLGGVVIFIRLNDPYLNYCDRVNGGVRMT